MGNLLFSPSGRIGPSAFMKGLAVLALVGALIKVIPLFSYGLGSTLQYAGLLLLVPLVFLLIKRSHDAGRSGWMSILWVILIGIVSLILQSIATNMTGGAPMAEMKAATEELALSGAGFTELMTRTTELATEYGPAIAKNTAIPTAIASFLGVMGGGFLVNLINKHNPHENAYGPVPHA